MSAATFIGAPCHRGHSGERYVSSKGCVPCSKMLAQRRNRLKSAEIKAYRKLRAPEISVRQAEYHQRHGEQIRARKRAQYADNAAERRARATLHRRADPERAREQYRAAKRRSYEKNPSLIRAIVAERRHTRRAAGTYYPDDIDRIENLQNGLCAYCQADLGITGFHIDHIVALAVGGTNWASNLCLACPTCNVRKGTKSADEFHKIIAQERIAA